jgi:alkylated DNA repair dioxygenase AlkB
VTLGCAGIMTFKQYDQKYDILLDRRSVVVLTGDARWKWTHEINPAKNHIFTNDNPRISLTFRKIIKSN